MSNTNQLLLFAFQRHRLHTGAVLGNNFMECPACRVHVHAANDSGRLYFHWQNWHDPKPVTTADDPRLRGDALPTAAEILASTEAGLDQRLKESARQVVAHGAPHAEYRTTWQSGAVLFHNMLTGVFLTVRPDRRVVEH